MSTSIASHAEGHAALDAIEQALAAVEAALSEREKRLATLADVLATPETGAEELMRRLEREGDVAAGLAFFTKRAQESAREAAYAMREREMALEDWLARAADCRQKLAEWDAGSVR
ncbi:hypothetical protein AYO40_03915 [Planctomycetaceae bacterium SCGC AG-212-D15]|nr:hypothetical protein AYO40_03915 [Planctomycetaceae bacterium SCGC AG-212-D15]